MSAITIEPLTDNERSVVHDLLRSYHLPIDGFDAPHVDALVAKSAGEVVGSAALEVHGSYGLLRSVAVAPSHRDLGIGQQLTSAVMDRARARGLSALYLLTETAATFFPKFGFAAVSRDDVPDAVKQSIEFTTACPASAQAFHLSLTRSVQ